MFLVYDLAGWATSTMVDSSFIQGTCRIMIFVYKVPMLFKFGSVMAHKEKNNEQEH